MAGEFGKTVLHGIAQSVDVATELPDKGNMASECFDEELLGKHVYDLEQKTWLPMEYVPFRWSFSEDGGFIGFHSLVEIPANTIIFDGLFDVLDPLTSGGAAKITLKLEAAAGDAGDILVETLISSAGTLGLHDIVPVGTIATSIKTTADRWVKLRVTDAAVTGGVLVGFLRCFRGFASEEVSSSSSSGSSSSSSSSQSSSQSSSSSSSAASSESSSSAGSSPSSGASSDSSTASSGASSDSSTASSSDSSTASSGASSASSASSAGSSASSNEP